MGNIRLCQDCIFCLINKYAKAYPEALSDEEAVKYIQSVLEIISKADLTDSAPVLVKRINDLQIKTFGALKDFTELKRHFNSLMLSLEDKIKAKIALSQNRLASAVKYAIMGNYIDFGTLEAVDEKKLLCYIEDAENIIVNLSELEKLERELGKAKSLVYLTDNCGEIVTDKILISLIKEQYPDLKTDVIVRGADVLNDATMADARQVGLCEIASVCDNGTQIAGTCLDLISDAARSKIDGADIIIAKGQGNFETLRFCNKNIYYLFMCKCEMFAKRFNVAQYSPMLVNDLRLKQKEV